MLRLSSQKGFSLIEVAVAITLLGIIIGSLSSIASMYLPYKRIADTKTQLSIAKQALTSYIKLNGRIPCPLDESGTEISCRNGAFTGNLPAKILGLNTPFLDGWGRPFFYAINPRLSTNYKTFSDFIGDQNNEIKGNQYLFCRDMAINAQFVHQYSNSIGAFNKVLDDPDFIYSHELAYTLISGGPNNISEQSTAGVVSLSKEVEGYGNIDVYADDSDSESWNNSSQSVFKVNLHRQTRQSKSSSIHNLSQQCLAQGNSDNELSSDNNEPLPVAKSAIVNADDIYYSQSLIGLISKLNCPAIITGINAMETQTQISAKIRDVTAWQDDYYDLFTKFLTAKNLNITAAEKKLWEMRTKALADLLSATAGIAEANSAVLKAALEVIKTIKNLKTEMKKASDEYKAASKKLAEAQAGIDEKFIMIKNVNYQQRNFCNYSKNEVKKYSEAEQESGTNEVDLCASW
tara:strand:- start:15070 stop:16452 length:1383 start_codon:yes stop_codon:yes gene_type:complete